MYSSLFIQSHEFDKSTLDPFGSHYKVLINIVRREIDLVNAKVSCKLYLFYQSFTI